MAAGERVAEEMLCERLNAEGSLQLQLGDSGCSGLGLRGDVHGESDGRPRTSWPPLR